MNDERLREELARCHEDAFAWALHCCRDRERAGDVLQAAYLKVLDGRARFSGTSSFKTWLFAVIRLTALDAWRERPFEQLPEIAVEPVEPDERIEPLRRALTQLAPRQREVLLLVFYHELTVEEAAHVMGIGVGSARTHYARGKEKLKACLTTITI